MTTTNVETPEVLATADPGARLRTARFPIGGSPTMVGPLTHLAVERERLVGLTWHHFTVRQLGATVGAELDGIDLSRPLAADVVDEVRAALYAYKVIFFRDQPLDAAGHVSFARQFGELEIHPFIPSNTGEPALVRFAKSAEVAGYENSWHHDVTWRIAPSMGAVLHAIDVPAVGGDTLFCDMYAAYEGLSDEVKARIDGLGAEHDFVPSFGRQVPADKFDEIRSLYPVVRHPVVACHPGTGRRHLYVNRNFVTRIVGIPDAESATLLDHLCRQSDIPEYQCRFHWERDSIAFWDNRAVQHYASSDYWPTVRVMERASIIGPVPTGRPRHEPGATRQASAASSDFSENSHAPGAAWIAAYTASDGDDPVSPLRQASRNGHGYTSPRRTAHSGLGQRREIPIWV